MVHPQDTVYHVFSNGGFLFLSAVLLNQKRGAICKNLVGGEPKGIIVDSAPGDITPDMAVRGFGAAAMKTHSDGFGESFRLGVEAARATFGAYLNLPPIKRRMQVRAPGSHAYSVRPAFKPGGRLKAGEPHGRRVQRSERGRSCGLVPVALCWGAAALGLCLCSLSAV